MGESCVHSEHFSINLPIDYFLQRFVKRQLTPRRRHSTTTVKNLCQPTEDRPCLIDISNLNFDEIVLNPEKVNATMLKFD